MYIQKGFTLVELLVAVAVIAILAAIALPNFLEAQARARVSRVKSDLRTIATALEAYYVDHNHYPPNDGVFNVVPLQLTTPAGHLSSARMVDPFTDQERHAVHGELARFYTYQKIVDQESLVEDTLSGFPPPVEAIDAPGLNEGAFRKYGRWRLVSNGPDREYSDSSFAGADPILLGSDVAYDPTNGTVSWGNVLRTQVSSRGFVPSR